MSTQQPSAGTEVTIPHPFNSNETLEGERVGTALRTDSPFPWVVVRVGGATVRVPAETLSD